MQENVSWAWGFAIPAMAFAVAITLFASGSRIYRRLPPSGSPFVRIYRTVRAAAAKRQLPVPEDAALLWEVEGSESAITGARKMEHSDRYRCLIAGDLNLEGGGGGAWRCKWATKCENMCRCCCLDIRGSWSPCSCPCSCLHCPGKCLLCRRPVRGPQHCVALRGTACIKPNIRPRRCIDHAAVGPTDHEDNRCAMTGVKNPSPATMLTTMLTTMPAIPLQLAACMLQVY